MATSGTIGATALDVDTLLTKAIRRCGLAPESLTPEIEENARSTLFMLLVALGNVGLNLWCMDQKLLSTVNDKRTYRLPTGTTDILNLLFCTPTLVDHTDTITATSITADLTSSMRVVRLGAKLMSVPTAALAVEYSTDGITWSSATSVPVADLQAAGSYNWIDLDPPITAQYIRVSCAVPITVVSLAIATDVREVPMLPYNRDDYSSLTNKQIQSSQSTGFFFEKLINPQLTLWPVPNDDRNHLKIYRYRQIQDVGDLTNTLEIPVRWFEPVCWQLALRLAFEIPSVQDQRRKDIASMSDRYSLEAGTSEVDGSPIYLAPNIAPYTR